jgi:hypothetical protein
LQRLPQVLFVSVLFLCFALCLRPELKRPTQSLADQGRVEPVVRPR